MMVYRYAHAVLCFLVFSFVAGCSQQQQMLGGVSETDVNEAMRVLVSVGIDASKKKTGDASWTLYVPDGEFARAADVLRLNNLPRAAVEGLGQVFRKDSLVSSELEERARLIHALSQELQQTLMFIDGVLVARVHPVILPRDSFSLKPRVSAASVFIKYRKDADLPAKLGLIKSLVANSIEGLSEDKVTIAIFPSEAIVLPATPVAASKGFEKYLGWYAAAAILLIALAAAFQLSSKRTRTKQ
jgi:type III secretion protein J